MKRTATRPRREQSAKADAPRLTAADWIAAALKTMAHKGIANVRVESLAKDLKVTKGSFYWHFRDREALLDAMLDNYRNRIQKKPSEEDDFSGPLDDLISYWRTTFENPVASPHTNEGVRQELAIRLWARRSAHASEVVKEADRRRIARTVRQLASARCSQPVTRPLGHALQATLFYLYMIDALSGTERRELIDFMLLNLRRELRARE